MPARRIVRDVNEAARDVARALAKTEAFARSRRDRKKVEMLFAHLKRILRLARLRLRGPSGAQFEFTLAAIAQNLKRLAKLVARPTTGHVHGVPGVSCGAFHRRNADAPHGVRGERMDAPSPQKAAAPINATSNPTFATISAQGCRRRPSTRHDRYPGISWRRCGARDRVRPSTPRSCSRYLCCFAALLRGMAKPRFSRLSSNQSDRARRSR